MSRQNEEKKTIKSKKSLLLRACVFFVAVYSLTGFIALQFDIIELKSKNDQSKLQQIRVNERHDELERLVELGDEKDYIVRFAREKLGFSYADEKVFIDVVGE